MKKFVYYLIGSCYIIPVLGMIIIRLNVDAGNITAFDQALACVSFCTAGLLTFLGQTNSNDFPKNVKRSSPKYPKYIFGLSLLCAVFSNSFFIVFAQWYGIIFSAITVLAACEAMNKIAEHNRRPRIIISSRF